MAPSETARAIEQLQNRIASASELPETVRSDVIVALGAARAASQTNEVKRQLAEAIAALEREAGSSPAAAEIANAIRGLQPK
jgi:aspartate ammonia-lyase